MRSLARNVLPSMVTATTLVGSPAYAHAATRLDTTPYKGGWVFGMGWLILVLGAGFAVLIGVSYVALKSRFEMAEVPSTAAQQQVPVPKLAPTPIPPAIASTASSPSMPQATQATLITSAPASTSPAPMAPDPVGIQPDQETFDRVLAEQLAKGVNQKVAEGRARAAAIVAARKKAGA